MSVNEMKSLTLNGTKYDSFQDQTAREEAGKKLPAPTSAKVGQYLKVTEVDADGKIVATEAVDAPSGDSSQIANVVEPAEDDTPCVYLYTGGKGMPFTKSEGEVQIQMDYESRTRAEHLYLTAKVQGGSSASNASYKKRNWTFKFYKDGSYEDKLKLTFKGWPAMNKFVLKAGWVMPGHLRNVGAAKIWGQIMRCRSDYDSLPEELRNSPNQGATDGFHVRMFVDGMYWGIYDWIVAKDQLFGQDKDNPAHSILNSELNNQPSCAFATTTPTVEGNWSEELQDTMTEETKTSMENWIKFVAGSSDADFVANAESYFDVQTVLDASAFDRIMMTVDNLCRNQIVFKYGTKWYMGKWDLDAILGLPPLAGQGWCSYDTAYQEGYEAYKSYGIINMLYDRTEKLFLTRFKENYWRLRKGPLSENNLVRTFGALSDRLRSIEGLMAEENASTTGNGQFTEMPNVDKDTIQQIREIVVKRCAFMDEVVENMTYAEAVPCTGISLSADTLTFTATGTQTLTATVTPDGCIDAVIWESDNTDAVTVSGGVVTAIANGSATITAKCGEYSATCAVSVSGIVEVTYYSVTNNLTNCTNSNNATSTVEGGSYSATITANSGYVLESVTVTHNGVAVPVTDGAFTIDSVAGDIVITASAVVEEVDTVLYTLPAPVTFGGTDAEAIATGINPYSAGKDFTVAVDFVSAGGNGSLVALYRGNEFWIYTHNDGWRVATNTTGYLVLGHADSAGFGGRFVIVYNSTAQQSVVYGVDVDGNEFTSIGSGYTLAGKPASGAITIGDNPTASGYAFKGTVNAFIMDQKAWSADEIAAFLNA